MIGLSVIFFAPDWARRLLPLRWQRGKVDVSASPTKPWIACTLVVALTLFVFVQVALPLRHYLYPGNVRWNEEGYRFAWRVMLTEKVGFVQYRVKDTTAGQSWLVSPHEYLTPLQAERMAIQPDMILQTAHFIARDYVRRGHTDVAINADAFVSYNGRPNVRLIDPDVDLASIPPGLAPKTWILPNDLRARAVSGPPQSTLP